MGTQISFCVLLGIFRSIISPLSLLAPRSSFQFMASFLIQIQRGDGVIALILTPTRELAIQTHEVISTLLQSFVWVVSGVVMGGEKKKSEKARLRKGVNVLVGTPGRVLDHLQHTQSLVVAHLQWLVLDEADRCVRRQHYREAEHFFHASPIPTHSLSWCHIKSPSSSIYIYMSIGMRAFSVSVDVHP